MSLLYTLYTCYSLMSLMKHTNDIYYAGNIFCIISYPHRQLLPQVRRYAVPPPTGDSRALDGVSEDPRLTHAHPEVCPPRTPASTANSMHASVTLHPGWYSASPPEQKSLRGRELHPMLTSACFALSPTLFGGAARPCLWAPKPS